MKLRTIISLGICAVIAATAEANITSTSLRIQGAGLEVVTTTVTTSIDLPTTVQTKFAGKENDQAVALEGVMAVGDLTGPGIETPIQLTTAPGHRFQIPGLSQQGIYYLQNVRLMKGTEFLQSASPATAVITVADLLQTKVTVKQLSADELRQRGITVDTRNYDVYEYSFTFIIDGKTVTIPFPVIIDPRTHQVQPVKGESPYVLPPQGLVEPPRWSPPQIIAMDFGEEGELPEEPGKPPVEKSRAARVSIPAAIVIPNSLAVLHQFFAVAVMVTNGAPEGSAARLEDIKATIKIPTALRTVKTTPQVSFGQGVPIVEPTTGVTFLVAQARGEAEWTLEGLQPGTHRIDFDLRAVLRQEGQVDTPMRATPSAAIVVHDPRFNINFSHPDTVRKGIEYSTYSFITNMSATDQTMTVTSGVESCDVNPGANVCRLNGGTSDSMTIPSGDMRLIEYRLRAGATGRVFATAGTLSSTDNLSASVSLYMGVSESGIPLSPATLILPHYAQYVEPDVVSANLQLLGLGYSLATAPLNAMTAKFPRVIRTDVFQRAVDIARAGQRIFITDANPNEKRDSISHLTLDLLGNGGYELREWDQLRRQEKSGRSAGAAVIHELETTGLANGATMTTFFDAFASATAHRNGFVAALAHGGSTGEHPYAISLQGVSGRRTELPNEAASDWVRDIPYSDISRFNGAGENGELALIGRWTEDIHVKVTPASSGPFQLEILYPDTTDGRLKRAHFEINGSQNETLTITLTRGATSLNATFANGGFAAVGTVSTVDPAPLRIAGSRQDLHLDEDGHKVSVLFNRPVKAQDGVDLKTKFAGEIDFNRDGVIYKGPRPISAAALQEDGRTVNTTFDHSLSQNATYTIQVGALVDPVSALDVSFPDKISPKIDNDAPAGIVSGKVIKGDNTPIAGVDVVIRQYLPSNKSPEPQGLPQYDVSQANGSFLFEFVRREINLGWTGAYRLEGLSSVHGTTNVEGSVRLPGAVHFVNLQYLGRGAAEGTVRYNDGSVVPNVTVTVGSTMFSQFRTAKTDAQGAYRIDDLPVGPLTFSAKDEAGNVTFAANEIATPGQLVTQNLSIFRQSFPGVGKVYGVVRRSDTNALMAGVHVGVYSQGYGLIDGFTDSNGRFEFDKIPAGFVSVLAEEWTVARQSVAVDIDLKANEVKEANLLFFIQPDMKFGTLTGEVWRENPLQPGLQERVPGALVKIDGYRVVTADADGKFIYENIPLVLSGKNITTYDPATQRVKTTVVPTLTEAGPNFVALFIDAFDRGEGKVRVRLLNASGNPVAGYRVIVPGFPPDVLQSTGAGVYEMPDVPVGTTLQIRAVPSGLRPENGTDPRPYGDQMASGSARVEFNGHIASLTLRLPGEGTVRVKVRSQFDLVSPVKLTYPVWYEGGQHTEPHTLEQSTEKNGSADWAVFTKIPVLSTYSTSSAHPQYGYAGASGQLSYNGDFNDHVLQLNTLATVRGTVYAIDGVTPVSGASVTIANGRSDPGTRITGPDGKFEFIDQPSATNVTVTAQITQSGIYRIGFSSARTPNNGGVVDNMSIVLRKRGLVDGQVVYKDYKVFDDDNPANNVADNTPGDYSDNAPVPLAKFYLRELDFPNRSFGSKQSPLTADINGRFVINNVFVGSLRATGWDSGNQELRGDWTGRIDEEGQEATPKAYIAVTGGLGGVGSARVTVVDPNQSYAEVQNAEVSVYAGGGKAFDFGSTDATGAVQFDELPVGTYTVSAYSKALGKTSKSETVSVPRDAAGTARLELEFSGTVDGTLTDPENNNAPVPGSHVRLTASNYQTQSSTDIAGFFLFQGVREGSFALDAKDTLTNRRAHADRSLTVLDPHRTVSLLLEPTETLHFAAYLPDDFGNKSNVLAAPVRAEAVQRCYTDLGHVRHCDYERQLQGNPLAFAGALEQSGYSINVWQPGDVKPSINLTGTFPKGSASNPFTYVYPAYGEVRVTVTQGGAPANGAKVTVHGSGKSFTVYTDATGQAKVHGVRLGGVYVQAASLDNKFTGSASVTLQRQSVPVTATIALGTYAGITGYVEAEAGGPSAGTRVVASYPGKTAEVRTDANGRYTFLGIPTPATGSLNVNLLCIGPDDATVGGSTTKSVKAGDDVVTAPNVKLDATAPQLETILPADGSTSVSPDSSIAITFTEPLSSGTITASNFQLVDADGVAVSCTRTSSTLANGKFTVTLKPAQPPTGFPLRSNTLYRVIVSSNVTDTTGHRLPSTLGFTFTTSDYAEPRVQKVLPASPIPAATTFEFRFNEPINPAPWTAGTGVFHVYKLAAPGGAGAAIESVLAARTFVDSETNMTLSIAPEDSNPILPESFYRVVFSGVTDPQGNVLGEQTYHFYSFDQVPPHVVFTAPASGVELISGSEYEIRIELRNGSASGSIAGDIKKVEYFTVAANGTETPFAIVQAAPFYTKVIGPETPPSGATFTVGAQAYDASGNQGPKSTITWTVKPNAAPTNVVVAPVQTSAYPSTAISARVTFQDEGSFASVTTTFTIPKNNGTIETKNITKSFTRLANGTWPEAKFDHVLTTDSKAGELVTVTARVTDVRGLTSAPATATIDIASDIVQPNVISVTPAENTAFLNKAKYIIEAIVSDGETGVQTVTFLADGISYAVASQSAGPAAGTLKFRSVEIETRSKAEDALIPIIVTAKDYNGNTRSKTHDLLYKGVNDPEAPKVTWLCPIDRAALPALANNFALKLRLNVVDQDIRTVTFRIGEGGPTVTGALISGTEYGATYTFPQTPPAGALTITAIVEDTVPAHTVELPIDLDLVTVDFTFTDPKAITAADVANFTNKTIVMNGSAAVLAPQVPLMLKNLLVLNGARVETLPTTITREFKVDITTSGVTYVDCDSRVDVSSKGYVGGWQNTSDGQNSDSRGRTVGNVPYAFKAYGSIFEPTEMGTGGNGAATCCSAGGAGGGAIILRGGRADDDSSRIVIPGDLLADGAHATSGTPSWAPGSGGSVWLDAKQILLGVKTRISVNGGDHEWIGNGAGGARGGRIAITAMQKVDAGLAVIEARGGRHVGPADSDNKAGDFDPGTIYLRRPGQEAGELKVSAFDSRFPNTKHYAQRTPIGRISGGTSTAIATNALTDASRTFDRWMIGEKLVIAGDFSRSFRVIGISPDAKTFLTEPADGSLLDIATSQTMAYTGLLAFDRVTLGQRTLARFDDHVMVNDVIDDRSVMVIDPTAVAVFRNDQAELNMTTTPAAGETIIRDAPFALTYTAAAAAGVGTVTFTWSPETTPRTDTYSDYPVTTPSKNVSLTVPPTTPLGPATLQVAIVDRASRTHVMPALSYNIIENAEPVISGFTVTPGLSIHAGRDVIATVISSDDVAVKTVTFNAKLNGTSIKTQTFTPNTMNAMSVFTVTLAPDVAGGSTLTIDATVSDGFAGRAPQTAQQTVAVLTDSAAPQVTITAPAQNASYRETIDKIAVRVTAVDAEVGVKEITAQLDGGVAHALTRNGTTNDWSADITAPPVDGTADVQRQVTVTTRDYAGNTKVSAPVAVTIKPVIDANAPVLVMICGSPEAMFPVATTVKIRVSAAASNAQNPVQSVEMLLDDVTPLTVASLGSNLYEGTYAIPAATADGTIHRVRVIARSAGGAASDFVTSFTAIAGPIMTISASTTIDTTTTTYDNKTVVITAGTITIRGNHTFDRFVVLGGSITAPVLETLNVTTSRGFYVACGATLSLDVRGYPVNQTYPGARNVTAVAQGGSHLGRGGAITLTGATYGSVERPREAGAGDIRNQPGGGVVRINAATAAVDGIVRANGGIGGTEGAGAGGSIWITATKVTGGGTIMADGGNASWPGGGGAIAIEYTDPTSILPAMFARPGSKTSGHLDRIGGAGTVFTRGPQSTFGAVTVDSGGRGHGIIDLPSLGSGVAQANSSANTLVTDRTDNIGAYFVGHWVRVTDNTGAVKGTWRIATISAKTATLTPNAGETISIAQGDKWQGLYRFDTVTLRDVEFRSADLVEADLHTIAGTVTATSIKGVSLDVIAGATLTHPTASALNIDITGELHVASGAAIDVTWRGYPTLTTYPGARNVTVVQQAASHIGRGASTTLSGATYGSIERPRELGAGDYRRNGGGGVVRINAASTVVDGVIRANGGTGNTVEGGGAGGSVWITTTRISGTGSIETDGGASCWAGGGGAMALEYTDPTSVVPSLFARPGTSTCGGDEKIGGAGTVFVRKPQSTFGAVTIDSGGRGDGIVELPSLGSGVAQDGSSAQTLVTDRTDNAGAYFVGHWVRITDSAGIVKGTWRIATISAKTVTLASNAGETISIAEGDKWQGVYRFDAVTLRNVELQSADPLEAELQTIAAGTVTATSLEGGSLELAAGATLTHPTTGSLNIDITGELRVNSGAAIDVTWRGYPTLTTYPGARNVTVVQQAASHIGRGGGTTLSGATYGSIERPRELGAGDFRRNGGGGAIRINAGSAVVNGVIRANGGTGVTVEGGGAGGSIWMTTARISGSGTIEADGGASCWAGGGGALALEYTDPTSVVPPLFARPGTRTCTSLANTGGAGTVFLRGPLSTFGDVTIHSGGRGTAVTELPSLGNGLALDGSSGATLVTDRTVDIPSYFIGHWVRVFAQGGSLKGTWRILSVNAKTFTLQPNDNESIDIAVGDTWRGIYRFDKVTARGSNVLLLDELQGTRDLDASATITVNEAPVLNPSLISTESTAEGDFVRGTAGAVTDLHTPIVLTATNTRTGAISPSANPAANGSFSIAVAGESGDTFTLYAVDSFALQARSTTIAVSGALQNVNGVTLVTLQPQTATGGSMVTGSVRMLYPVVRASAGVVTLSSSSASATVPATVSIPVGASSAAFQITTTSVAAVANVVVTASSNGTAQTATLTLLSSDELSIAVDPATIEGGGTVNGAVTLGVAAPPSGATVSLFSSNTSLATVPPSVVIPDGALEATFSIMTSKVAASASATITAIYGQTKSATLELTECAAIGAVDPPASAPLTSIWIDDALPPNATSTGDGTFTTAQAASGAQSVSLSGTGATQWTVSGMSFVVAPADNLVLYALVNPCNPPREILATWNDGTNNYRASWGEDLVDATLAHTRISSMPSGGVWMRLEVLASRLFGSASKTIKSLTVKTNSGELWIDRIGTATCSLAPNVAPPASFAPFESVWVDDQTPAGVTLVGAWTWDSTQSASGSASHVVPLASGVHQNYYSGDPNPIVVAPGDVLFAHVLIDPCNPPREIMLQWNDGSSWYRATWGEDLISGSPRYRVGPMPEAGKWVRLEVPAAAVGLNERKIYGAAFTLYDGRAWFDRSGKFGRVNLALNQPARQSGNWSLSYPASRAVDGKVASALGSMSITDYALETWWEVDLGTGAPMIDSIEIRGRTDCCTEQASNITVFVSDDVITAASLTAARALSDVDIYRSPGVVGSTYTINIGRRGRYVRIWRGGTDTLSLAEVFVWAPASAARVNLAAGKRAYAPPAQTYLQYYPEHAVNGSATDAWNTTGGIFHSTSALDPYWQVDLGKLHPISSIDISSRTDCCPEQLTGYYVLASDQPFTSESLAPNLADSRVSVWWVGSFLPVADIPVNRSARYVRLQRPGSGSAIVFTEVRVWSQQPNLTLLFTSPRRLQ
ncbi:MAG: Ig-like domain-containing protein [Acidobacteriota bacterium]|nr:Ig-like domain-containing protein [Acidobacteriota bacterium]